MVELGMFVESIAEELSMDQVGAPSLQRSNTVEHKSLACASAKSEPHEPKCDDPAPFLPPALCCPPFRCGESHARTDPPPPHPPAHPPPFVPRPFSLHFPLREADVLELVASFSRGQKLSRESVEQLLDRHLGLLQPLPNASVASCKPSPHAPSPHAPSPHATWHCRHARPRAALGRRGVPPASLKGPRPDALPVTQPSPRRSPLGHGRHGRVAGWPTSPTPLAQVVRFDVPAGQELCIVGDLHGQFEVRASGLLRTHCYARTARTHCYARTTSARHRHHRPLTRYGPTRPQDLMHIFRTHGFPAADRPFLFNGDFVDRGTQSVEVLLTLYAWQQLLPGSVLLNRGNHEERSVNVRNGFEHECAQKYDGDMHERFVATFAWLPLGTLVNGKVPRATYLLSYLPP